MWKFEAEWANLSSKKSTFSIALPADDNTTAMAQYTEWRAFLLDKSPSFCVTRLIYEESTNMTVANDMNSKAVLLYVANEDGSRYRASIPDVSPNDVLLITETPPSASARGKVGTLKKVVWGHGR